MINKIKQLIIPLENKSKVFGIGFNKTGTTSLTNALMELGYFVAPEYRFDIRLKDCLDKKYSKTLFMCRFWEAFQDIPFSLPDSYKYLHPSYPSAKFILTIRDSEEWYNSITKFHSKLWGVNGELPTYQNLIDASYRYKSWSSEYIFGVFKTPKTDPYNKSMLIEVYEKHNYDVIKYFENKSSKLLVLDVSNKSSGVTLCNFLNKETTKLPNGMPWKNKTLDK